MPDATDEWGEYNFDAGSTEPVDADEVGYDPCNAVLKFTYSRYGEKRYCTGMAVGNFGNVANYEHPEYCKHHQSRAALREQNEENFSTGAFVKSYEDLYNYLPVHKQMMAIDLYKSLLNESIYADAWDSESVVREIEASDTFGEGESVYTDFPIPTEHRVRAASLWFASLDFIKIQNITEEQFRVAYEDVGPDGRPMTVGEDKFQRESESGETYEVKDEHHLNLPLSRIQKDYKEHLKMGGVPLEADGDVIQIGGGREDWVLEIEEPEPEAAKGESPLTELTVPDED